MKAFSLACMVALVGGCAVDGDESFDDVNVVETEQAATQSDVWHGTWNGGSANLQSWNEFGGAYLDVFENGSGQNRIAYVNYSMHSVDPESRQCASYYDWWYGNLIEYCWYNKYSFEYGWGQIPAADAQFTPNHAGVKTTLGANISGYRCTVDYTTYTFDCGAPNGSSIDVRWRKDGVTSSFQSGTSQQVWGAYTFKSQGTYRSASARASGTIGALSIQDAYGQFGSTRGTNVTKSVMKTPKP